MIEKLPASALRTLGLNNYDTPIKRGEVRCERCLTVYPLGSVHAGCKATPRCPRDTNGDRNCGRPGCETCHPENFVTRTDAAAQGAG